MQLGSSWNRRGFLGTAAALVASLVAPRKLHSRAKEAHMHPYFFSQLYRQRQGERVW